MNRKPLGRKAYGSIAHLPKSRLGPGDHKLTDGQTRILTEKARDKHDTIIVQEKLDGSNVAVANHEGQILALTRAGYLATTSRFEQHHLWAEWVRRNETRFAAILQPGERVCGEWLAQAHGTRYELETEPFVAFDLMIGAERLTTADFWAKTAEAELTVAMCVSVGAPIAPKAALEFLGERGAYGAEEKPEGVVYRCERKGTVDFLGKYVRPDKLDGTYLPEISGRPAVWNWRPA